MSWDDGGWGRAAVIEEGSECHADSSNIGGRDTERGGRKADLRDEVADLCGGEVHVLVHRVLRGFALVGREGGGRRGSLQGAAEEDAKVLVQMSEEVAVNDVSGCSEICWAYCPETRRSMDWSDSLLVGSRAVGRHVHHQWYRSAVVEEVHCHSGRAVVRAGEPAVKVRQQVDIGAVVHTGSEDTRDLDANIGLRIVANDRCVDHERQERGLVGGRILLQQCGSIVVADRGVGRALGKRGAHEGEGCELEEHVGGLSNIYSFHRKRGIGRTD